MKRAREGAGTEMIESFLPIARADARVLLLGSMPGVQSLAADEYYAYPQNIFWDIMQTLFGIERSLSYDERMKKISENNIALWDVLSRCERQGSLDAAISKESEVSNDFVLFFETHPKIRAVFFNGAKAEASFKRHVFPGLNQELVGRIVWERLPSTSPAYAAMKAEEKIEAWRIVKKFL